MKKIGALAIVLAAAGRVEPGCVEIMDFQWTAQGGGAAGGTGGQGGAGGAPVCIPGEKQDCPYSGPQGTKDVGNCRAAKKTCKPDGSGFGDCDNTEVTPQSENCTTTDDEDCDGATPPCDGSCVWSKSFGDAEYQEGTSLAVDTAGNVIMGGVFTGTTDFGGGPLTGPASNLFLALYSGSGSHAWSKAFGDPTSLFTPAIAVDAMGNVYAAGAFQGSINFDGDNGVLTAEGGWDVFAAKREPSGGPGWSIQFGDSSYQATKNVAMDGTGNVILAGEFSGSIDFGGAPLVSSGGVDAFVAKLDGQGAHIWSSRFGTGDTEVARALAVDGQGNVLVGGMFAGTVDFGGGPLISKGDLDVFVAKLASSGAHIWSRSFGDGDKQSIHDVAVDSTGDVFVTGSFAGTVDFGGGALTGDHPVNVFAAKLSSIDGAHVWSKTFGDAANQAPVRIATTKSGVALAGGFAGTVDFGGGPLAALGDDVFVAKLSADGSHLWSKRFGDPDNQLKTQWATSIAADGDGDLFLTGFFQGQIDFGCGPLTSAGDADAFLVRLSP